MSCKFICDGCGRQADALCSGGVRRWIKPFYWYQRSDEDGIQDACSRKCIDKIAKETEKPGVVLPI